MKYLKAGFHQKKFWKNTVKMKSGITMEEAPVS
jgi:hypothetical protein